MSIFKKLASKMNASNIKQPGTEYSPTLSSTKRCAQYYSPPYVVPPASGTHRQSFIVLHGRGDNNPNFGTILLTTHIPVYTSLVQAYPDASFIFPTASLRRAEVLGRSSIHQWFDLQDIKKQTLKEELQFEGLKQSFEFLCPIIEQEIEKVGSENVVLWGLSQGMATAMITMLMWTGPKFAAAVGMCGWVPLKARMEREVREEEMEGENPFREDEQSKAMASAAEKRGSKLQRAARYLREELDLPAATTSPALLDIPVFIGHGKKDGKVPPVLADEAKELLELLEFDVGLQTYDIIVAKGHWYSGEMLHDIIEFLEHKAGIKATTSARQESGKR